MGLASREPIAVDEVGMIATASWISSGHGTARRNLRVAVRPPRPIALPRPSGRPHECVLDGEARIEVDGQRRLPRDAVEEFVRLDDLRSLNPI